MRILAVIPARGGSKGIPRKNLVSLAGRPLIAYTILAAKKAKSLERVVVSTEDPEIASVSKDLGVEVLQRPADLAKDSSKTHDVLLNVASELEYSGYKPEAIMTLQPTSPLRTADHIDEAAALFIQDSNCDSLVSCVDVPHVYHPYSIMKKNSEGYLESFLDYPAPSRRQDKESVFARNGAAIYITRTNRLASYIFGGKLVPYFMASEDSLDIDCYQDLVVAERHLRESS